MFALMTLFVLMIIAGTMCAVAMAVVAGLFKFTFHAIFWPLKLLLLPLILVGVFIKIVLIAAAFTVVAALLIPIAIVGLIFAAPVLLLSALT